MSVSNLPEPIETPEPPDTTAHQTRVLAPGVDAGFVSTRTELPPLRATQWDAQPPVQQRFSPPVFGTLAVIFGVTAFYKATLMLAPLAIVAGLLACLRKQWGWGLVGILSAIAALAIDPYVWGLAGMYWLARALGLL